MDIRRQDNLHRLSPLLYLVGLGLMISALYIGTTMARLLVVGGQPLSHYITRTCWFASVFMYLYAIVSGKYRWWELLLGIAVIAMAKHTADISGYNLVLWMTVAVFCAKGIRFNSAVLVFTCVNIVLLLLTMLLSHAGVIQEIVIFRGEIARHSLGMNHPNTLGAHILFLSLGISYLRREKFCACDALLMLGAALYCWYIPQSRTSALCLCFASVAVLISVILSHFRCAGSKNGRFYYIATALVPILCCVLSLWLSASFDPADASLAKIDMLLSGRLRYSHMPYGIYPVTPFGQKLVLAPATGPTGPMILDNWYVRAFFQWGVAPLVASVATAAFISRRAYKAHEGWLPFLVALASVYALSEALFCHVHYNIFLVALFAQLAPEKACLRGRTNTIDGKTSSAGS